MQELKKIRSDLIYLLFLRQKKEGLKMNNHFQAFFLPSPILRSIERVLDQLVQQGSQFGVAWSWSTRIYNVPFCIQQNKARNAIDLVGTNK